MVLYLETKLDGEILQSLSKMYKHLVQEIMQQKCNKKCAIILLHF